MNNDIDLNYEIKKKMSLKYKRFASEIATSKIEFRSNLKYHTAATDGKNIYIDPEYYASLSEDERLFVIAHEFLHIKFIHPLRLKDKNGNKRDMDIYDEACDAIINANLERDGFTVKEGYVNRPEAKDYTAEEFYEILLKEKKDKKREQENQKGNNGQSNGTDNSQQSENTVEQTGEKGESSSFTADDHSMWEKAFEEYEKGINSGNNSTTDNGNASGKDSTSDKDGASKKNSTEKSKRDIRFEIDERAEFTENRKEKIERYKAKQEKINRKIRGEETEGTINLGDVGSEVNSIDWKTFIRKEIEKPEITWSKRRRSMPENNYAYGLEEIDREEDAHTEVMIDVSGSVSLEQVKAFLRSLKSLLKQSSLRVGCFNEKFWGMVNIKNVRDIDNFTIPEDARGSSAWTEDWDLAVRSFSKDRNVNKIVFTDGWPQPGTMPKEDLKGENVIWLVYGNRNFNPCCGKVKQITEKELKEMQLFYDGR